MKWIWRILLVLAVLMMASWWWATKDYKPLTDEARAAAPGQFAELSAGKVHYRWLGPDDGDVIVMAHGFSTPNFVFEQNARALADAGHRVLLFDHFGRGWSDRPRGKYSADFYDAELVELLNAVGVSEPVGIVGLSMGGVIVSEFASRHSGRVSRVALLVPAGLDTNGADGVTGALLNTPIIGNWLWTLIGPGAIKSNYAQASDNAANALQGDAFEQMRYKGYFPALHSSLRNLAMADNPGVFERLEATGIPTLAIYGTADTVVEISSTDKLAELMPSAEIVRIEGGDHAVNINRHDEVSPLLVSFFQSDE